MVTRSRIFTGRRKMYAVLEKTTEDQREKLAIAGFVHVTGLTAFGLGEEKSVIGENLPARSLGKFDSNNGKVVVVTIGGEVWLGSTMQNPHRAKLVIEFCPNGRGAHVPCSNGEQLGMNDVLNRLANPDYNPRRAR